MKLILTLLFLLYSSHSQSQDYYVSRVIGTVFYDNKPLRSGQILSGLARLHATDRHSVIRVVNEKEGSFVISFQQPGKATTNDKEKTNEFFELVLKEYIDKYNKFRSLSTKGTSRHDWFDCFTSAAMSLDNRRVLIIADEKIPKNAQNFNPAQKFYLFTSIFSENGDSLHQSIPIISDSILFSAPFSFTNHEKSIKLKISEKQDARPTEMLTITDTPVSVTILSRQELNSVIRSYSQALTEKNRDKSAIAKDISDLLHFNLGFYFSEHVEPLIEKALAGQEM